MVRFTPRTSQQLSRCAAQDDFPNNNRACATSNHILPRQEGRGTRISAFSQTRCDIDDAGTASLKRTVICGSVTAIAQYCDTMLSCARMQDLEIRVLLSI